MTDHLPKPANVYYLTPPVSVATEAPDCPSTWVALRKALRRAWWRLRITATELRQALMSRHRSALDESFLLDDAAETLAVPRRPTSGPGRVLDFETARLRLRPGSR